MKAEREKAGNVKEWKKPADDSSLVKGWRKAVTKSLQSTMNLQAKFKASGGGVANRPHMIFKVDDNQKAQIDARKDLTRATIENAKAHLQIALEGYLAQQETARKMNESTLRMQQEMATVRRELAQLDQKKITLVSNYLAPSPNCSRQADSGPLTGRGPSCSTGLYRVPNSAEGQS